MRELSLNVLDIAQNSIAANASLIEISVLFEASVLTITISDNGCGMDEETVKRVLSPFYTTRTTRKVGMGVPLFSMAARMTGGDLSVRSAPGKGTTTTAVFYTNHIDFTPLGDMGSTISTLISCNPTLDFVYTYGVDGRQFVLDTRQLRQTLAEVPLSNPDVALWIREYITESAQEIDASG